MLIMHRQKRVSASRQVLNNKMNMHVIKHVGVAYMHESSFAYMHRNMCTNQSCVLWHQTATNKHLCLCTSLCHLATFYYVLLHIILNLDKARLVVFLLSLTIHVLIPASHNQYFINFTVLVHSHSHSHSRQLFMVIKGAQHQRYSCNSHWLVNTMKVSNWSIVSLCTKG